MNKISRKGFIKIAAAAAMSGVTAGALAACNAASGSTAASGRKYCAVTCGRPMNAPMGLQSKKSIKKRPPYWVDTSYVGISLFFRAVTSQVSSAPLSLTSVFGMGTGGPSASSTPTY